MDEIAPVRASTVVPCEPVEAFRVFTDGFGTWWPAEFTWSQPDLLQSIGIEPHLDGLLRRDGPHGFRMDWGRITGWEPPRGLTFTWQISAERVPVPDPARASIVDVAFRPDNSGTLVTVEHRAWHRHGPGAADYRSQFDQAWPMALDRLRRRLIG